MSKSIYIILLLTFFLVSCKPIKQTINYLKQDIEKELTTLELKTWYQKDYQEDTIPGISLDKWYRLNKNKPKSKSIIVAVIDTQIDLKHDDLQGQIWINTKEVPNNGMDDDHNGYIDDINGWSFIGTKSGRYVVWNRYEYVRIVQEWEPLFKGKIESQIDSKDLFKYNEYQRALKKLEDEEKFYKNWLKSLDHHIALYSLVKDTLKHFFPKEDYTYEQLDSLYQKYKINDKRYRQRRDDNDKDLGALISYEMVSLEVDQKTLQDIVDKHSELDSIVNKSLNIDYDDRLLIGDNANVLEKGYGNNNVSNNKAGYRLIQDHCTKMAGVMAANRENNIGIKGIAQNVKIMPLNISPMGDENGKDITMAIRYAVDNGAKIINMSFSNSFSLHKEWAIEAFKYAEEHDVLLVRSAGNEENDSDKIIYYPTDITFENNKEFCSNFITVGSITHKLDSTFVSDFSNYGKQNVDLFAPGDEIYSTTASNKYEFDSGTSFSAPMVCGTAALIWSYYPKLTVQEVKQIILDSGTAYDLEVIVPGTENKKVLFADLSKSGKVLNVYNAMKLAEKVSKKRK